MQLKRLVEIQLREVPVVVGHVVDVTDCAIRVAWAGSSRPVLGSAGRRAREAEQPAGLEHPVYFGKRRGVFGVVLETLG